jgi:hypothetical protein
MDGAQHIEAEVEHKPWTGTQMTASADERRALKLLANSPFGCTKSILLAHGFKDTILNGLVRHGLAIAQPGTMRVGRRKIDVVRVMITDAGRRALAG